MLNLERIKKLATEFSIFVLKDFGFQPNSCLLTCYPLSLHLENNGIPNSVEGGTCCKKTHYWIRLNEYPEIIVDPTFRQFELDFLSTFNDETTYGGRLVPPYLVNPLYDPISAWEEIWKERLLNKGFLKEEYDVGYLPTNLPPFESILNICLRAAIVVISETEELIEQSKINASERYKNYRSDIKEIIGANKEKIQKMSLPRELDHLLKILDINLES